MAALVSRMSFSQIATMQTAEKADFVSAQEYLDAEATSQVRHEYLGGLVYAMAGETVTHNLISQNLLFHIRRGTKGGPCRVFIRDIRVNFHLNTDEYFYYPDIVVTCDKRDTHPRFVRHPKLIIEVLSESTERIDKREKFLPTPASSHCRNMSSWPSRRARPSFSVATMVGRLRKSLVTRRHSNWIR